MTRPNPLLALIEVLVALAVVLHAPAARANDCYDCKKQCDDGLKQCRNAAPKGACKLARPVCTMFKNAQCPAARKICLETRCGTMPDCDGHPLPGSLVGDPHFYSLDRARYDYQGVGEFVVARSKRADVEIQARFRASGANQSVTDLVAIRSGGHTLVFRAGDPAPMVDDRATVLVARGVPIGKDLSIFPTPQKHKLLVQAGGTTIYVVSGAALGVFIAPAADTKGSWEGLLGDFDGDPKNDFVVRGGAALDPSTMTAKVLHEKFGHSWRLTQAESFLPYGAGESTETFTKLDFPRRFQSIAELSEDAFAAARATCVGQGVHGGERLRNCIYDVALAGEAGYAADYAIAPSSTLALALELGSTLAVRAQQDAYQGEEVPVYWSVTGAGPATVTILGEADRKVARMRLARSSPMELAMPKQPGTYVVELAEGDKTARQAIEVRAATASLQAPDAVEGASVFEVSWQGPGGNRDYVSFARKAQAKPREYLRYQWVRGKTKETFQAPAEPGTYELRYVLVGADGPTILATRPIQVTAAKASVEPPASVKVGRRFAVTWTGPAGRTDFIDLVPPGETQTHKHITYGWVTRNVSKEVGVSQVELRAPTKAGAYKLRYVAETAAGRAVLAEAKITVDDDTASVTVPAEVAAQAKFEARYVGPIEPGNYVAVVKAGEPSARNHETYAWVRNSGKATLTAPRTPGAYEVVFILEGPDERRILARAPLKVTAP